MSESTRFNVVLDEEHAAKLHNLADRTYVNPGTIARSLLSSALDQVDSEPLTIAVLLDAIPGALESALDGRQALREGRAVLLEDF